MSRPVGVAMAWLAAMNDHDLLRMSALYTEDVIGDEVPDPPVRDREGLNESYRELFYGYPDCRAELINIFSGGDQVLAEIRWTGTNTRKFRGQPPTNELVDLRITYIFKIERDKIRKITEYYDSASARAKRPLEP